MYLLVEFGGTNARFALVSPSAPGELLNLQQKECAAFSSAEDALRWYMDTVQVSSVDACCISFAGSTDVAEYKLNNVGWVLSSEHLRSVVGATHIEMLNDFEALAYALPFLKPKCLTEVRGGERLAGKPMVVLGPGTGLGVAGLLAAARGGYSVIKSEGGGIGFAPDGELEQAVLQCLSAELGRVTCEDLLCGRGLVRLHRGLAAVKGIEPAPLDAAEIGDAAIMGNDGLCVETVLMFSNILGHFAGDLALMFNAGGGVFLGGGILPKLKGRFLESAFVQRFESRGAKSQLVEKIPVYLIEEEVPALVGAGYRLMHRVAGPAR